VGKFEVPPPPKKAKSTHLELQRKETFGLQQQQQQQQRDKSPHQFFKEATARIKAEVFGSRKKSREQELMRRKLEDYFIRKEVKMDERHERE
jgi:hypothetical protein